MNTLKAFISPKAIFSLFVWDILSILKQEGQILIFVLEILCILKFGKTTPKCVRSVCEVVVVKRCDSETVRTQSQRKDTSIFY